jgi:DNA-binding NtrC family response regulator
MEKTSRILVIEDDLAFEPIFKLIFENIDPLIKMDWAQSGEEAIALLQTVKYELAITDIFLDGPVTGIDFYDLCRETLPELPVIVMSTLPYDRFLEMIQPKKVGAPFFQKPTTGNSWVRAFRVLRALLS